MMWTVLTLSPCGFILYGLCQSKQLLSLTSYGKPLVGQLSLVSLPYSFRLSLYKVSSSDFVFFSRSNYTGNFKNDTVHLAYEMLFPVNNDRKVNFYYYQVCLWLIFLISSQVFEWFASCLAEIYQTIFDVSELWMLMHRLLE